MRVFAGRSLILSSLLVTGWAAAELTPAFAGELYWVDSGAVWRADTEGDAAELVAGAPDAEATGGLDVDAPGGRVYWTAYVADEFTARVRRADLGGSNIETFGGGGKNSLGDVALDLGNDKLYYTDPSDCTPGCGSVRRADLDGSNEDSLIALDAPGALAVDSDLDRVCWGDEENDWIQCADLNGSIVLTIAAITPSGLALDADAAKIYWTDPAGGRIRRADLDGSNVEDVVSGLAGPYDVALDPAAGKLYWSERDAGKIRRANLGGTDVEDVVSGLGAPEGIALDPAGSPPDPVPAASASGLIVAALLLLTTLSLVLLRKRASGQ